VIRVKAVRIYPGGREELRDTVDENVLSVDEAIERIGRGFYVYVKPGDLDEFRRLRERQERPRPNA
jgi:hypothetical protein